MKFKKNVLCYLLLVLLGCGGGDGSGGRTSSTTSISPERSQVIEVEVSEQELKEGEEILVRYSEMWAKSGSDVNKGILTGMFLQEFGFKRIDLDDANYAYEELEKRETQIDGFKNTVKELLKRRKK